MNDALRYATVSGSHTNQALRLWFYGCDHQTLGHLSLEQLQTRDSGYYHAVVDGLDVDIVSSVVPKTFPQFPDLAQNAANAVGQQQRGETELQLCRKVVSIWQAKQQGSNDPVAYGEISPSILLTKPPNGGTLPSLYAFILKCGGGKTGHLMLQTEEYVRCFGNAGRCLGTPIWDALSSEVKRQNHNVLWRHALLKTLLCHHERLVSVSDIKRSLTQKDLQPKVQDFEKMLSQLRGIGRSVGGLSAHQVDMGVGTFEVESVLVLLQKKPKEAHEVYESFDHVEEAAHKAVKTWREQSKDATLASPWESFVQAALAKPSATKPAPKAGTRTPDSNRTGKLICFSAEKIAEPKK